MMAIIVRRRTGHPPPTRNETSTERCTELCKSDSLEQSAVAYEIPVQAIEKKQTSYQSKLENDHFVYSIYDDNVDR